MKSNVSPFLAELLQIRNQYGASQGDRKAKLLRLISPHSITGIHRLEEYYNCLLFLLAYPDNKTTYQLATDALQQLEAHIKSHRGIQDRLFNSGVTGTKICAAFGFELVRWLRKTYKKDVTIESIEADDIQLTYILSVVMPKVESEILQDANTDWKHWLKKFRKRDEDLLDTLIAIFEQTDVRPEVKDELWNALGINITVNLINHCCLPASLFEPYYHRSLKRHITYNPQKKDEPEPVRVKLTTEEAAHIIDCGRMILVRHTREIDPVTFTQPGLVSYYQVGRGISIALMGMSPERRHPLDSYMGYVAFKNGLPVAYAGSWILFDSARIGLNVFTSYRGGESLYIFKQILNLHKKVYRLRRFTVDPYQIGKDNDDGIKSGAFWVYHHMGFRPIKAEQKKIAEEETVKIKLQKGYRSPAPVLKKLADSRMELIVKGNPVRFDATDLSIAYAGIIKNRFNNNRNAAMQYAYLRLVKLLHLEKAYTNENLAFVLKNWSVLLMTAENEIKNNKHLKAELKQIFELKANGSEEKFIYALQGMRELRGAMEGIV